MSFKYFTDTMVALMLPEHKEMILSNPTWMKLVFRISTIVGLIGSIGLIMRKEWAVSTLLVSLIAVVIQMGYSSFATDALVVMDQSHALRAMIVIFSALLWWYSKRSGTRVFLS